MRQIMVTPGLIAIRARKIFSSTPFDAGISSPLIPRNELRAAKSDRSSSRMPALAIPKEETMNDLSAYLDRLRDLIPARTLALYVLGIGLVSSIASTPEDVSKKYGWMLLLVTGVCLVINFVGRLLEKKSIGNAAISSGAFFLLTMTQRFTGPLAALGVDSQAGFVVASFLAAVYVVVITMVWKPQPA